MLVSIITVTLNSEAYIEKCLESITTQNYKNIEHIIIDGKSNDSTLRIINSKKIKNTKVLSEPDNGIYDAMNKGLSLASGEVIGFLNADDFFAYPDALIDIMRIFEDRSIGITYGDLKYVERNDTDIVKRYWRTGFFKKGAFKLGWYPPHPTFYSHRSLYLKFGNFDTSLRIAADVDLMLRFMEQSEVKSVYIKKVLVKMRIGGISNATFLGLFTQLSELKWSLQKNYNRINYIRFIIGRIYIRFKQKLCLNKDLQNN